MEDVGGDCVVVDVDAAEGGGGVAADEEVGLEDLGARDGLVGGFAGVGIGWERRRE